MELADRLEAMIALGLAGDTRAAAAQIEASLAAADEARLRTLTRARLELLVELASQSGLDRAHPEPIALARRLLGAG